jgi:hypothetical protein
MKTLEQGLGALLAFSLTACASSANLARPAEDTAGSALGEHKCDPKRISGDSTPYSVDWSDDNRAALESAMSRGIAVVKSTCDGVEVLKACTVSGEYAYRGISKKTKLIKMKDESSVSANMGPASLPVAVSAELKQGKSLDLAYAFVGSDGTTVASVSRDMLQGRCDGATHFVYQASVGAFALGTSAGGQASAAAEVFGYGKASGSGASDKSTASTDGDLKACEAATEGAKSKIDGCKALFQVQLYPIDDKPQATQLVARDVRSCPAGFTYADSACVPKAEAKGALCEHGDEAGCKTQCLAGSKESCGRFSTALIEHNFGWQMNVDRDKRDAVVGVLKATMAKPLREACDAGEATACTIAAYAHIIDMGNTDFDVQQGQVPGFVDLVTKGCRAGETVACNWVILTYGDGLFKDEKAFSIPKDMGKLVDIAGVGCDRGSATTCLLLSGEYWLDKAINTAPQAKLAVAYARRACTGGIPEACAIAGTLLESKEACTSGIKQLEGALKKKHQLAMSTFANTEYQCDVAALPRTEAGAKEMFALGCKLGDAYSCGKK